MVVSRTTVPSRGRVAKLVFRERQMRLPAGFVPLNMYVTSDVIVRVFTVQYGICNSQHPEFVRSYAYPSPFLYPHESPLNDVYIELEYTWSIQ